MYFTIALQEELQPSTRKYPSLVGSRGKSKERTGNWSVRICLYIPDVASIFVSDVSVNKQQSFAHFPDLIHFLHRYIFVFRSDWRRRLNKTPLLWSSLWKLRIGWVDVWSVGSLIDLSHLTGLFSCFHRRTGKMLRMWRNYNSNSR